MNGEVGAAEQSRAAVRGAAWEWAPGKKKPMRSKLNHADVSAVWCVYVRVCMCGCARGCVHVWGVCVYVRTHANTLLPFLLSFK